MNTLLLVFRIKMSATSSGRGMRWSGVTIHQWMQVELGCLKLRESGVYARSGHGVRQKHRCYLSCAC